MESSKYKGIVEISVLSLSLHVHCSFTVPKSLLDLWCWEESQNAADGNKGKHRGRGHRELKRTGPSGWWKPSHCHPVPRNRGKKGPRFWISGRLQPQAFSQGNGTGRASRRSRALSRIVRGQPQNSQWAISLLQQPWTYRCRYKITSGEISMGNPKLQCLLEKRHSPKWNVF